MTSARIGPIPALDLFAVEGHEAVSRRCCGRWSHRCDSGQLRRAAVRPPGRAVSQQLRVDRSPERRVDQLLSRRAQFGDRQGEAQSRRRGQGRRVPRRRSRRRLRDARSRALRGCGAGPHMPIDAGGFLLDNTGGSSRAQRAVLRHFRTGEERQLVSRGCLLTTLVQVQRDEIGLDPGVEPDAYCQGAPAAEFNQSDTRRATPCRTPSAGGALPV